MENEEIIEKFVETVWNKKDLNGCNDCLDKDVVLHRHRGDVKGLDNFKKFIKEIHTAFPDYQVRLKDVFSEKNKVCVRWEASGTHKGKLLGNDPTNKKVEYDGINIFLIQNEKIKEVWMQPDLYGVFKQLGILSEAAAKR